MIASSAALFAIMATLAAGHNLHVLPNAVSRDQAIKNCAEQGLQLAAITSANLEAASAMLPAGQSGWIASWNGDNYQGACLQLKTGTITAAASCLEQQLPICEGHRHPEPPCHSSSTSVDCSSSSSSVECPSSSSSVDCSSSSSSIDCSSSSSTECDWSSSSSDCDSSSSFSCSDSVSSDICRSSSSSSSSSDKRCDPCCAGVRKLTYQAPFGPGIYLAKVTQRFSVFDVFGPNACANVAALALTLGVEAVLVGSDGQNFCSDPTNPDTYPYGTSYVVSRAWALNQPIYALLNGVVSAANSLYNCYGEYRAIHLSKPLSELTFVTNSNGNVCFDRCKGKPRSCVALCQADFARPGFLPQFKMGN